HTVYAGEPADPAPGQYFVDRRGGDTDLPGDLDRPQALLPAHMHDLADHRLGRPVRRVPGARGGIAHRARPELAGADSPPPGGRPRHVVTLGSTCDRPALIDD